MRRYLWLIAGAGALVLILAACEALNMSPEQKATALEWINQEVAAGRMTQTTADAMIDAMQGGKDWIARLVDIGLGVAGSLTGVRLWRGSTLARKGASPSN